MRRSAFRRLPDSAAVDALLLIASSSALGQNRVTHHVTSRLPSHRDHSRTANRMAGVRVPWQSCPCGFAWGFWQLDVMATCIWALSSVLTRFNYNAWYGGATGDLISTSLQQIEDGHLDRVLKVWRGLDQQYRPTYENRAHYNDLVKEATARMRGDVAIEVGSAWDASVFRSETWLGHWEDGYGYWIVINDIGRPFDVLQSGQPRAKVHDVSVSPDFRVLKFKEGDQWQHTLTLKNKYEVRLRVVRSSEEDSVAD